MCQRLKKLYNLKVKEKTVLKLLREIDPSGVDGRCQYRLKRRNYSVPGPNFIWHADGHDKLKRYGFSIYGIIDGFSKKILLLEVSSTNKDPRVIGFFYYKLIEKLKYLPEIIRTDRGTEVGIMENAHITLRYNHNDSHAGVRVLLKERVYA